MKTQTYWSVEVTDHDPILGGKTIKFPFAYRAHAELWAKEEVSAAKEFNIDCTFIISRCAL